MKYYAKYMIKGCQTKLLREACGTDSILPLDGRLSMWNMQSRAREHARCLNKNHGKGYEAFRIYRSGTAQSDCPVLVEPIEATA
jgi:hypothetical protein